MPYWVTIVNKQHLVISYSLDTNDARYALTPDWDSGQDFYNYLKATFDCLYREGRKVAKIMNIGLHARLSGRPGRCEAVRQFIEYIKKYNDIWICKREQIADIWYQGK